MCGSSGFRYGRRGGASQVCVRQAEPGIEGINCEMPSRQSLGTRGRNAEVTGRANSLVLWQAYWGLLLHVSKRFAGI